VLECILVIREGKRSTLDDQRRELTKRARLEKNGLSSNAAEGSVPILPRKPTSHLQNLYRPPIDLAFGGDWDEALMNARQGSRWLLINIQMAEEFASQGGNFSAVTQAL